MYHWICVCISDQPDNTSLAITGMLPYNNLHIFKLLIMFDMQYQNVTIFALLEQ